MPVDRQWYWQRAYRTEIPLRPFEPLTVQLLVLQLGCTLLARLLVQLAMCLLALHAAVLDEETRSAVFQLDGTAFAVSVFPAVGAHASWVVGHCNASHLTNDRRRGVLLCSLHSRLTDRPAADDAELSATLLTRPSALLYYAGPAHATVPTGLLPTTQCSLSHC